MIPLLIVISVIDIRSHRIPNWSIASIFGIQAISKFPIFNAGFIPAAICVGFIFYRYLGVGAGDIKLLASLLICAIEIDEISNFVLGLAIGGFISSVILLMRYRRFSIHIPLAPAITFGFIVAQIS